MGAGQVRWPVSDTAWVILLVVASFGLGWVAADGSPRWALAAGVAVGLLATVVLNRLGVEWAW